MNVKVKAIYTIEMDELEKVTRPDPERFCMAVSAMVGPADAAGEESFDIKVCTP